MDVTKHSARRTKSDSTTRRRPPAGRNPARETAAPTARSERAEVTFEERHRLIAAEAYLHAERRGFAPGSELEDWLNAERYVDERLGQGVRRTR